MPRETRYLLRLRAPKGLDLTLIKELRMIGIETESEKMDGRKAVQLWATWNDIWTIMAKSRIAEDCQVRITTSFLARGENELRNNLRKVPWHAYLRIKDYSDFKMP